MVGVSRQGKAVVSDGWYGVIGGGILFISMGVMRREPRGNGGGDGVGLAPLAVRSLFSFGVSVILKI